MSNLKKSILCVAMALLTVACAFAQSSMGAGAISGTVTDPSGAVVSGANVIVENAAKGIKRQLETSSGGVFTAPNLIPADGYTVTVSKGGFDNYLIKDITVSVGATVTLTPVLRVGAAGAAVEVTAVAPLVDQTKTSVAGVVTSDQILNLPSYGRRVDVFVALSPGVSNDGAFGLLTFRGNPGGNIFLTDGVDTTNAYYGENAGRTRAYNISQDAVQEFQVVSSNYAAEFGKASGGVVNTVTRSGTNGYHGTAYDFWSNATLAATDATTVNGLAPHGINPPAWRHQAGVSVGGPIKKDKLFFFYNGEIQRRNAPLVSSNLGSGSGNSLFNGDGTFKSVTPTASRTFTSEACVAGIALVRLPNGTNVPGPNAAQCAAATAYVVGRVSNQLVPRKIDNNTSLGKIDWHPTDNDSVSFMFNYVDFRSTNNIQTQLAKPDGSALGNNSDSNVFDRTARASWTRVVTPTALNEFRFGFFRDKQEDPGGLSLIPTFSSGTGPATASLSVLGVSGSTVSNLGWATNYPRVNPSESRFEFTDNFSWTKGRHNFKFGVSGAHQEDFVLSLNGQWPSYSYQATSNSGGGTGANAMTLLALDILGTSTPGKQAYNSFGQTVGTRQVDLALWETSIYAQDEWHITPQLTLTPGLRYEYSQVPQPGKCNSDPRFINTCKIPTNSGYIAPRLGFAYSFNSKTVVRGGYGIFNSRYITSGLENLMTTNGVFQNSYSFSGANITAATTACLPTFATTLPLTWVPPTACAQTLQPSVIWASPNFRPAYSEQANLAIEHEFAKNTSLSVSYVWSRALHIQVSRDDNALLSNNTVNYRVLDSSGNVVNTYSTQIYQQRNPIYNNANGSFYAGRVGILEAAANSYYDGLLVSFRHRRSNWLQSEVSYTWSHTIDWLGSNGFAPTFGSSTPTSYYNGNYAFDKGSSNLDRRHALSINLTFSPTFMHSSSALAKYVVNGWELSTVNGLASSQALTPSISGSANLSGTPILATVGGLNFYNSGSLNGLGGGGGRVPFMSTSALNVGPSYRTDARMSKTFPVTERVKVQAGLEVYNLLNHLIVTGRNRTAYNLSFPTTGANAGFGVLTPNAQYGAMTDTIGLSTADGTTARRAQALLRITF